jgi:hypothetical protein
VDGKGGVYRYAKNGATALAPYKVVVSPGETPFSTATDVVFYSAYAAGATYVKIGGQATDTQSATANGFRDGWLFVFSTDTAYCQYVRIDSHTSLASSTALGSANEIWLERPGLQKTVATDTAMVKLIRNPYMATKVFAGANQTSLLADARALGVPQAAITASYYYWLKTWGTTLLLAGGGGNGAPADKAGQIATLSTGDTGAYGTHLGTLLDDTASAVLMREIPALGAIMTAAPAANFYSLVNLNIAP